MFSHTTCICICFQYKYYSSFCKLTVSDVRNEHGQTTHSIPFDSRHDFLSLNTAKHLCKTINSLRNRTITLIFKWLQWTAECNLLLPYPLTSCLPPQRSSIIKMTRNHSYQLLILAITLNLTITPIPISHFCDGGPLRWRAVTACYWFLVHPASKTHWATWFLQLLLSSAGCQNQRWYAPKTIRPMDAVNINKLCGRPPQYAPPLQVNLWPFDLESGVRLTWATYVPILVFLGLCILDFPMYATSDSRRMCIIA